MNDQLPSPRRFARFGRAPPGTDPAKSQIPESGMCLSTFLLVHPPRAPDRVLMGRIRPSEAWLNAGALDASRHARASEGWMLPSRQWAFYETPEESARNILAEQLPGISGTPRFRAVASEAYRTAPTAPADDLHWDLHFLYDVTAGSETIPPLPLWEEVRFFSPAQWKELPIARRHGDILALANSASEE
jgi:hypothetical protein